jgi:hypothetical protein
MFHYLVFRKREFIAYHPKRSNVESRFSMMKRKLGESLPSKTDTAMVNETPCEILCLNCRSRSRDERLGIDPAFWSNSTVA